MKTPYLEVPRAAYSYMAFQSWNFVSLYITLLTGAWMYFYMHTNKQNTHRNKGTFTTHVHIWIYHVYKSTCIGVCRRSSRLLHRLFMTAWAGNGITTSSKSFPSRLWVCGMWADVSDALLTLYVSVDLLQYTLWVRLYCQVSVSPKIRWYPFFHGTMGTADTGCIYLDLTII